LSGIGCRTAPTHRTSASLSSRALWSRRQQFPVNGRRRVPVRGPPRLPGLVRKFLPAAGR
jgi:hypothetical protein